MKRLLVFLCAIVLVFGVVGMANAIPISIFNTGVDSAGILTVLGTPDEHYSLLDPDNNPVTANADGDGLGNWLNPFVDGRDAQWITPGGGDGPVGEPNWTYSTTFDLTKLNFKTAIIVGQWTSDNGGEIFLNNVSTGFTTGNEVFMLYHDFTFNSGFIAGINTLTFKINNSGNYESPSGLFVDFTSADAAPVPEPTTVLLLGSGLIGLVGFRRIFRKR